MNDDNALVSTYTDPEIGAAMQIAARLTPLQNALGLGDLSVGEIQLFAMVAHHTGLDPFTRQIYAIKRGGKVTHQTGIDGYRATAERTGEYRGSDTPDFEPCDCGAKEYHPKIARVTVYRAYPDGIRGQVGEARWHELKPSGGQDAMWLKMPENQLAKCAEANALRKAFPRVLGGVYIAEEMEQAGPSENPALVEAATKPAVKDRVSARRAAIATPAPGPDEPAPVEVPPPAPVVVPDFERYVGPAPDEQPQADVVVQEPPAVVVVSPKRVTPPDVPQVVQDAPQAAPDPVPDPTPDPVQPTGPGGCGWRLAVKGGEIVDCAFEPGHKGDHSWTDIAMSSGGKVLRPDA